MPDESLKNSSDTLPNGRNREIFHRECMDFMETFHSDLLRYAMHHTRGDKDRAHDLLHNTFIVLLKGGDNIDFTRAPRKWFNMMMTREIERGGRVKQRKFEKNFYYDPQVDERIDDYQPDNDYSLEQWKQNQRQEDFYIHDLLKRIPDLLGCLTIVERTHIEWYLDGLSYEEMKVHHPVTTTRIGQILTRAKKKLKARAEALLRGVS